MLMSHPGHVEGALSLLMLPGYASKNMYSIKNFVSLINFYLIVWIGWLYIQSLCCSMVTSV